MEFSLWQFMARCRRGNCKKAFDFLTDLASVFQKFLEKSWEYVLQVMEAPRSCRVEL
jgi:hypothetical protein